MEVVYYDGPTKPENVSLTKVHIKSGEKLQVSWSGITSKALDYVQYKVKNYDESTHSATTDYIAYSDSTKLGTTSSGTKTIDATVEKLNFNIIGSPIELKQGKTDNLYGQCEALAEEFAKVLLGSQSIS